VIEAANYIDTISRGAGAKIKKRAEHLEAGTRDWGYPVDLNEWLRFEIGAKEKVRALKSSALSIIGQGDEDAKNHLWRTAARAFVLVEILRSYRPLEHSRDSFLHAKRQLANACPTEQALRSLILPKLVEFDDRPSRVYDDQGSSGQAILKKAIEVKGRETGPAAMLTPKGTWLHHPMSNTPGVIGFKKRSDLQGIYTCHASGGCIPVAFLYGGKDDKPLDGVSLIHVPGGDYRAADWAGMALGTDPTRIVVFLSSKNNTSESDRKRYKKFLRDGLNYPEDLILFHLCSNGVNHGVDRGGHFGTVPDKFGSTSKEEKDFPDMEAN
jgi:hypothetical protein